MGWPLHVLLCLAIGEVAINRVAVPMLGPRIGDPPAWHTLLDYSGLFLFYFVGVLAVFLLAQRCIGLLRAEPGPREAITHALAGAATLLAAIPVVVTVPTSLTFVLEILFAGAVLAAVLCTIDRDHDLGIQVGLALVAVPLLVHTANTIGARFVWDDPSLSGPGASMTRAGVVALCLAALVSPYCFAPRPFARAVGRPVPILVAMIILGVGALLARYAYPHLAKGASLAIGVELSEGRADPRLALYLLAIGTLGWTLTSCVMSSHAARRQVGIGLALVLLGGYGFTWPHHFLLSLLGVLLISGAAGEARREVVATMPFQTTPPITDTAWGAYMASVTTGLKALLSGVHTLSTRGENGLTSSVIVGEAENGMPVRVRIERAENCVLALDVILGRDVDETRTASLTVWAIPLRALGTNPAAPPAALSLPTGDAAFDERFKTRGSAAAFSRLFDAELRERATTCLDGWLAYWDRESLRYRVYPGRGAPLDHPMPLSDLALGRPTQGHRLVTVISLLITLGQRGVTTTADPASSFEDLPV